MEKNEIRILVVEDEQDIRTLILHNLRKDGYLASGAATGEEALKTAEREKPQLVILDLMLPGIDGMAVCRKIRASAELKAALILMLTARGEEADMVSGLEAGADDYVVKPFSNRVLLARVRSLLRRGEILRDDTRVIRRENAPLSLGEIRLVPERMEATVSGTKIDLTAGEFKMLQVMMRRPGIVFTRNQLLDLVRGAQHAVTDRAVDVQIVGLRRKLGAAGRRIETVRGAGYRVAPE